MGIVVTANCYKWYIVSLNFAIVIGKLSKQEQQQQQQQRNYALTVIALKLNWRQDPRLLITHFRPISHSPSLFQFVSHYISHCVGNGSWLYFFFSKLCVCNISIFFFRIFAYKNRKLNDYWILVVVFSKINFI